MLYQNLKFKLPQDKRPFFYTSFVSTIDGKIQVTKNLDYWPIGTDYDLQVFQTLRSKADCIIQGKQTALLFGQKTIESIVKLRRQDILYLIISNKPDNKLVEALKNSAGFKPVLVTTNQAKISSQLNNIFTILRTGQAKVDLQTLSEYLYKQQLKQVLVEGGPTLLYSFLKKDLIDEVFLTIAPKIFGNDKNSTLTMVEGGLFPANSVKKWKLVSVEKFQDEVFLRYKILR